MEFFPFNPQPPNWTWSGPICPNCARPYMQTTTTTRTRWDSPYKPKHRKEGPAQ